LGGRGGWGGLLEGLEGTQEAAVDMSSAGDDSRYGDGSELRRAERATVPRSGVPFGGQWSRHRPARRQTVTAEERITDERADSYGSSGGNLRCAAPPGRRGEYANTRSADR